MPAPTVFWPYFAATIILILGFIQIVRNRASPALAGWNRLAGLGRLFFAAPLAGFAGEHFTVTRDIAKGVPSWIPAHVFWTYLVGAALVAAALSIVTGMLSQWAGLSLGVMFFLFVLLMDLPGWWAQPYNRIDMALALRELAFSGGGLALASLGNWREPLRRGLRQVAHYFIAVPVFVYGWDNLLHPHHAPVVPLELVPPAWIPLFLFWAYLSSIVLLVAGFLLLCQRYSSAAALNLGILVLLVCAFVYLPLLVAKPADIGTAFNYLLDTMMFGGAVWLLAQAEQSAAISPATPIDLPRAESGSQRTR